MKNEGIYMDNKEQKITSDVEQSLPQLNKEAEKKERARLLMASPSGRAIDFFSNSIAMASLTQQNKRNFISQCMANVGVGLSHKGMHSISSTDFSFLV